MGMGCLAFQPFRQVRAHRDLQGRERRRSPENRYRHSRRYSLTGNRLIQPVLTMRGIPSSYGALFIQRIAKVQTRNLAIVCLVCLRLIENAA